MKKGSVSEKGNAAAGRWALGGLSLAMLLASLGTSVANVALPVLAREFGASFQEVQWVVLAYLLAITALIVGVGRLGDVAGRRRLLLAGVFLFTAGSVLGGIAPNLPSLIAARGLQGLGAAAMMTLSVALIGETVPPARIGRMMGLLGTTSALGTALGPTLGGLLISGFGWRAVFFVNVPLGGLALLAVFRGLPADRPKTESGRFVFDGAGTLLLALTLAAYALALTLGRGRFGALNAALLAAALSGAILFVLVERKAAAPLIRPALFRDPALGAGLALGALVSTVLMATLVVGPFYLSRALGLDAALVGLAMSAGPLVVVLTGVPVGRLVDGLGAGRMTAAGLAGVTAGALLLAVVPAGFGLSGYLVSIVVMTVGYAVFQTANNTSVMKDVPADRRGTVSGMLNLSRNLGLVTGASLMGAVFALASGTSDPATAEPAAVAAGMRITFAVAAVLSALALGVHAGRRFRVLPVSESA